MDLQELGSRIRAERERQGLTIEQVMEITKISRVNINAIESGNQNDFPHIVYAKGFIKNYAKALGLDAEEIGEEFSKVMSLNSEPDEIYQTEAVQGGSSEKEGKSPVLIIALVVLLVALVGGLVYYLHDNSVLDFSKKEATEVAAIESSVPEVPMEKAIEESAPPAGSEESVAAEESEETVAADAQAVEELAAAAEEESAVEAPAVAAVANNVVIKVKDGEACWLEAVVDGSPREYVLQSGDSLVFDYKESLKLKLGNAGGVELMSDGKPFQFEAQKGKVLNLEFPVAR